MPAMLLSRTERNEDDRTFGNAPFEFRPVDIGKKNRFCHHALHSLFLLEFRSRIMTR
jgi:hypothetical protein